MDLRQMECYKMVVEEGSILKASLKLNMAQPPLSRMMRILEEELGTTLFIRGKRVALTNTGRLLYERACSILELTGNTYKEIHNLEMKNEITLNMGIVSSSTEFLYNKTIKNFHSQYPHVRFNIQEANTYQLIELLQQRIIDLAIVRTPFDDTLFEVTYFKEEPMLLLNKNPIDSTIITIKGLSKYPLIIYRRFKDLLATLFKKYNAELNLIAEVDDAKTAILLASTGLGYALVPQSAYQTFSHLDLYTTIVDEKQLMTRLGIITRKKETPKKGIQLFIDSIINTEF